MGGTWAHLPGLDPAKIEVHMRCLYQNTPDQRFLIGEHWEDPMVLAKHPELMEGFLEDIGFLDPVPTDRIPD